MRPEIKQLWIEELRSGRYEQGREALKDGDEYCCLGVLCELAREAGVGDWQNDGSRAHFNPTPDAGLEASPGFSSWSQLPEAVAKWAGLDSCNPGIYTLGGTEGEFIPLANLNDTGETFIQIASRIEEGF
jgi:hypothetical protein